MSKPGVRIGDQERDIAISALGAHFAAGRLTAEEHSQRVQTALQAQMQSQLNDLLRDLPRLPAYPEFGPDVDVRQQPSLFVTVMRLPVTRWALIAFCLFLAVVSRGELFWLPLAAVAAAYWAGRQSH